MDTLPDMNSSDDETDIDMEMALQCYEFKPFVRYYMPCVVVIGLIGNLLSALTFMATNLRKLPSSHYLTALAVADSGMLLCQVMLMTGRGYPSIPGSCQLTFYSGGVFSFLSVWYVVSFTLERFIVVRYPLKSLHWCTVRRARVIVISVAVFACVFNAHFFVSVRSVVGFGNDTQCDVREGYLEAANTMNHIDTVLTFILPLFLIVIWNAAIAAMTVCSKSRKTKVASTKRSTSSSVYKGTLEEGIEAGMLIPASSAETFLGGESRRHIRKRLADDRRITRMLLIVSMVFLLMNFPDHVLRMTVYTLYRTNQWEALSEFHQCWINIIQKISNILFHTNFAVNFFLYNLAGANFRQHLKRLLRRVIRRTVEKIDDILPPKCKLRRYKVTSRLLAWIVDIDWERSRFPSTSGYGTALSTRRVSYEPFSGGSATPSLIRHDTYSPWSRSRAKHSGARMSLAPTMSERSASSRRLSCDTNRSHCSDPMNRPHKLRISDPLMKNPKRKSTVS